MNSSRTSSRAQRPAAVEAPDPTGPAVDPYLALGVPRDADDAAIKRAYFQLVRENPPESAPERFKAIRTAYERVRSAADRDRTDLFLLQPPALPRQRRTVRDLALQREDIIRIALELRLAQLSMRSDFREPRIPS